MTGKETMCECVHCHRKVPRSEVLGYTHALEWTWICRNLIVCEQARRKV